MKSSLNFSFQLSFDKGHKQGFTLLEMIEKILITATEYFFL